MRGKQVFGVRAVALGKGTAVRECWPLSVGSMLLSSLSSHTTHNRKTALRCSPPAAPPCVSVKPGSGVKGFYPLKLSSGFPSQVSVILAPNQYFSQVSVHSFHPLLRERNDILGHSFYLEMG